MADFTTAINIILKHEGGWANNPNDPGGATNWGISLRWLKTVQPDADISTIRGMPQTKAIDLYRRYFWDPWPYGLIMNQQVATKVLDMAVNMGPPSFRPTDRPWAHIILQRAVNDCNGNDVVEDGIFGPQTLEAINRANSLQLLGKLISEQSDYYRRIAEQNPKLKGFLPGWLARAAWPLGTVEAA